MSPLAGDASNRRYLRLIDPKTNMPAVLMDAPPNKGEDIRPFVRIAQYLNGLGLSTPRILYTDEATGLLLLEDLGDDLFARVIPRDPTCETLLYTAATDVLVALHQHAPPSGMSSYGPDAATGFASLVFDWYASGASPEARAEFERSMHATLAEHAPDCDVLVQRDYHAENLLWLPKRTGHARVGLLDFQDAALGHRAYDLVSLLQDARRDVPITLEDTMIRHYISQTGLELDAFKTAYAVLGAQRNLRILGVFARLCLRDGKAHYVDLIPRVWSLLQRDLGHPALSNVKRIIDAHVPAPSPARLENLKSRCATAQTP